LLGVVLWQPPMALAVLLAEPVDQRRPGLVLRLRPQGHGQSTEAARVPGHGRNSRSVLPRLGVQVLTDRQPEEGREADALELRVVGHLQYSRVSQARDGLDPIRPDSSP